MAIQLGGAVSDIFAGIGSLQESAGYEKAAQIEQSNAQLAQASERIQIAQQQRQFEETQGGAAAGFGGAGLTTGGSAGDVLRSSAEQGALQRQIVGTQGQIQIQNYEQQSEAYKNLASVAKTSAMGSFLGGAMNLFGNGLLSFIGL